MWWFYSRKIKPLSVWLKGQYLNINFIFSSNEGLFQCRSHYGEQSSHKTRVCVRSARCNEQIHCVLLPSLVSSDLVALYPMLHHMQMSCINEEKAMATCGLLHKWLKKPRCLSLMPAHIMPLIDRWSSSICQSACVLTKWKACWDRICLLPAPSSTRPSSCITGERSAVRK